MLTLTVFSSNLVGLSSTEALLCGCGCVFAFNAFKVYNYIYNAFVLKKKKVRLRNVECYFLFEVEYDCAIPTHIYVYVCVYIWYAFEWFWNILTSV